MIIKAQTPGTEDKSAHWLFGNVMRYNVFKYSKNGKSWLTNDNRLIQESYPTKKHYLMIHLHMDDESIYTLSTDDTVWIMSDKGDTITKLLA